MSPIRHEDDFRRREIDDWDEYIQEQLEEAISRGEFESLPGEGKPLKIWTTDVNPEYDLAFSRLKNAGVMPTWMELDRDVSQLSADLDRKLEAAHAEIQEMIAELRASLVQEKVQQAADPESRWQRLLRWFSLDVPVPTERPSLSIGAIVHRRERLRSLWIEQATLLDRKIVDYHNALPRELSHLQRLRYLPERAARRFDDRIPLRQLLEMEPPDTPHTR